MRGALVLALVLALPAACSEDPPAPGGGDAAVQRDAAAADSGRPDAAAPDAAALDATSPDAANPDAAGLDAGPDDSGLRDAAGPDATADAGSRDASMPDAAVTPDAGADCGELGKACGPGDDCGGTLMCYDTPGICAPPPPHCGGFVQARCPAARPYCMYFVGADYGPCFTLAERDCICLGSGRRSFTDCP